MATIQVEVGGEELLFIEGEAKKYGVSVGKVASVMLAEHVSLWKKRSKRMHGRYAPNYPSGEELRMLLEWDE